MVRGVVASNRETVRGMMLARRTVLALGAMLLMGAPSALADVIKVGVVLTYSGRDAALGEQIDRAIELYLKQHAQDLPAGTSVQLVKRDDTGVNPDVAKRLAQELILREGVQILTGGQWTPNALAVGALAKEAKVPFVVMTAGGSAVTQNPTVIRTGWTLWQTSYPLGVWAARQPGLKKVYTVVSDFAPGHDGEAAFIRGFTEGGGEVIGSIRIPLKTTDYLPFLQRVKDAAPDAIYHFNPGGPQATAFMKALDDIGLARSKVKILGPVDITSDEELANMGPAALGVITASQYSPAADRPANAKFLAAWRAEYGADSVPTYFAVGAWDGMNAIFDAIKAQGGKLDPDRTVALLHNWSTTDSPRGPFRIDPASGDPLQTIYRREVRMVDGKPVNVELESLGEWADPFKTLPKK